MARVLRIGFRLDRLSLAQVVLLLTPLSARAAGCFAAIAEAPTPIIKASLRVAAAGEVDLTFLGHASFLIESPGGVAIVTDYNGFNRPSFLPDIVTMNHAHPTHYTELVDPGVKFVLRGWDTGQGIAHHDVKYGDVRIRNVPTNIRDGGATEFGGNSIFVFEVADLCIAHLSHLHHTLTPEHLAALGQVDVLLAPIDGAYTMSQTDMIEVIEQIKPPLVIPMHYFGPSVLERFLARIGDRYPLRLNPSAHVALSRDKLPKTTEILVLPGD
jgi:L-ascorbate metabolism protein UlaG (beta-lactamase superfamily)